MLPLICCFTALHHCLLPVLHHFATVLRGCPPRCCYRPASPASPCPYHGVELTCREASMPWNISPPSLAAHAERGSSLRRKEPSPSKTRCHHEVLIPAPSETPCPTTSSPLAATLSSHSLLLAEERRGSPEVPCNRRHEVLPRLEAEECGCRHLVALKAFCVAAVLGATSCCLPYQSAASCSSRKFPVVVLELLHRGEGRRSYRREEVLLPPGPVLLPFRLVVPVLPKREVAQTASHATSCDERIPAENLLLFSGPLGIHPTTGARPKSFLGRLLPKPPEDVAVAGMGVQHDLNC